jgi:hypothetical protein
MNIGRVIDIVGAIVVVAGLTVAVSSPQTSNIILSFGKAFANSLSAAMGQYAK